VRDLLREAIPGDHELSDYLNQFFRERFDADGRVIMGVRPRRLFRPGHIDGQLDDVDVDDYFRFVGDAGKTMGGPACLGHGRFHGPTFRKAPAPNPCKSGRPHIAVVSAISVRLWRTRIRRPVASIQPGRRNHGSALMRFACKLTLRDQQPTEYIRPGDVAAGLAALASPRHQPGPIRPRLFTVARRVAIGMWRARAHAEGIADGRQPGMPDPADCIEQAITGLDVRAALGTSSVPHGHVTIQICSVADTIRPIAFARSH
jgi:hypothetical protein